MRRAPYAWGRNDGHALMHSSTGIEREERWERRVQFSIPTKSHPLELFITCTTVGVSELGPSILTACPAEEHRGKPVPVDVVPTKFTSPCCRLFMAVDVGVTLIRTSWGDDSTLEVIATIKWGVTNSVVSQVLKESGPSDLPCLSIVHSPVTVW